MDNLITLEQHRWDICKVYADKGSLFKKVADRLTAPTAMRRYQAVSTKTGVPWQVIAVIHEREASQKWDRSIAQGDPWDKKSIHVPKNRGPFNSWEDAAYDALVNCPPYAARNKDWTPGGTLAILERYNGLGYFRKGVPSPYIWAGTDQYIKGKYISDEIYSANTVDTQLGVAGLLKYMGMFKTGAGAATVATGAVIAAGGTAIANAPQHYWPWIIGGTIAIAVVAGVSALIYNYNKRNN